MMCDNKYYEYLYQPTYKFFMSIYILNLKAAKKASE